MSIDDATQRFCVLASPEFHQLVITELGWRPQQHQAWFTELAELDRLADEQQQRIAEG